MSVVKTKITFYGDELDVEVYAEKYTNGKLAIVVYDQEGVFGKLSVNVPNDLEPNEFAAKEYSENETWAWQILKLPMFEKTDKVIKSGFVVMNVYKLLDEYPNEQK